MDKEGVLIGEWVHPSSGLRTEVWEHGGKRPYYTAALLGYEFKANKREKLAAQLTGQLDEIVNLTWTPVIEAYTRLRDGVPYLSVDRFLILQLPAGDLVRANWRDGEDDVAARLARCYPANLPPGFGGLPFVERTPDRQRAWMPYTESAWAGFQRSIAALRASAMGVIESTAFSRPTVFTPTRITRYEILYTHLETLISDHLDLDYNILEGEHWSPTLNSVLTISMDGYDDADRSIIEQVRSGERCEYALEILMRVLVEQHVLPEGQYLILAG